MEESFPPSPNPYSPTHKTLLHKPMKNLQDFVLKLAQAHPNAPLAPNAETLIRDRLDRFVLNYRTPDHPPYSAMIQNALQELNEKGGSNRKSISQFLEKKYDNLPWAHSVLLKHYLEETCKSGEIVPTRTKKYQLTGSPNLSTKVKSKPRRKKWRWECERQQHHQLKIRLIKKRNKQRGKEVDTIKKNEERDEKKQPLTEEGVHGEDQTKSLLSCVDEEKCSQSSHTILQSEPVAMIVAVNETNQTKSLLSCVDEEKCSQSSHTILQSEPVAMIVAVNETKYPEEVRSEQENGPSAIEKADISSVHTTKHQELEKSEHDQLELSTPERPPGFELVIVENLCEFDLLQSEGNMETPPNQQQVLDLIPITLKQLHHEKQKTPQLIKAGVVELAQSVTNDTKIMRNGKRGRKMKNKLSKAEQDETGDVVGDVFEPSLTSKEPEFALSTEQKPQELLQETVSLQEEIFQGKQLRRSMRGRSAKPEVAKDANTLASLPPEHRPVKVYRRQGTLSTQRPRSWPSFKPMKAATSMDELQDSPKSQQKIMILKQETDAAAVKNPKVVDDSREEDLKQSGKVAECTAIQDETSKMHLQKAPKKRRLGRPPERRSARLQNRSEAS